MVGCYLTILCIEIFFSLFLAQLPSSLMLDCPENEQLFFEGENFTLVCTGKAPKECIMEHGASAEVDINHHNTNVTITAKNIAFSSDGDSFAAITCDYDDGNAIYGLLARRPMPIKDPDCQLRNWADLYCSFSPNEAEQKHHISVGNEEYVEINTTVKWTSSNVKHGSQHFEPNKPILGPTAFTIGDNISVEFTVRIKYEDSAVFLFEPLHVIKSFNTSLIVKPRPVRHLQCLSEATTASCTWSLPSDNHRMMVKISLKPTNLNWTDISRSSLDIEHLKPHTEYTLEVFTTPMQGGFKSDPERYYFKTKPDVPGDHPLTTDGSFWFHNCSKEHCFVTVYFQPLPEDLLHHHDVKYNITLTGHSGCQNKSLTLNHGETNVNFTVNNKCDYNLDLIAYNELGESSAESSSIHLPRKTRRLEAPQIIVRKRLDDTAVLQWICQGDRNYTVYWCQEENKMCNTKTEAVQWRRAGRTCNVSLTLPAGWKVDETLFAISVQANNTTSGLRWNNQLAYDDTQKPEEPILSGDAAQAKESLHLKWGLQTCPRRACRAYVMSYNVIYCPVQDCVISEMCTGLTKYRTVAGNTSEDVVAVSPGIYTVVVEAVSHAGNVSSKAVCLTINEKWYKTWWFPVVMVAVGLGVVLVVVGAFTCARSCKKVYKWYQEGIGIRVPERQRSIHDKSGQSSGSTLL